MKYLWLILALLAMIKGRTGQIMGDDEDDDDD